MADSPHNPAPGPSTAAASTPVASRVGALWPVPVLLVATAALGYGLVRLALQRPAPDFAPAFVDARAALAAHEAEKTIDIVNKRLLTPFSEGALSPEQSQEVFLLRARALHSGQLELAVEREENHRAIIADYERAQRLGATLPPLDTGNLASSMIAIGDAQGAVDLARKLGAKDPARRTEIYRAVITGDLRRQQSGKPVNTELMLGLLSELLEGDSAGDEDRAWAIARQAELRLAGGHTQETIATLQRTLLRAERLGPDARGELFYLLGRAYDAVGDHARAAQQLTAAEADLTPGHPLRAATLVMAGRIQQAAGKLDDAAERFEAARLGASGGDALLAALLGLAETAAARRDDAAAVEHYVNLIEQMGKEREQAERERRPLSEGWVTPQRVSESLMDRQADRRSADDFTRSLRYTLLAETVWTDHRAEPPDNVLLAIGSLSRAIGERTLEESRTTPAGRLPVDQLSEVARLEIKRNLHEAGEYFRRHAQRVSARDEAAYRDSLWSCAECFDLAGEHDEAKAAFSQYASIGTDDPRRLEAIFRRGQILAAKRQFREAMADFRTLVETRGGSGGASGSGLIGERSVVPLARCLVADGTPEAFKSAEDLLTPVLTDGQTRPDAETYATALVELGELLHRVGRHAEAITRLTEAVDRYPTHDRIGVLCYKLADASRQSAAQIDADLRETMPQSRREELVRVRRERLSRAADAYQRAGAEIAAKDARRLTTMDQLVMRNSAFYLGDVAFEQNDYAAAIAAYDAARLRYSDDPASLVAMVQIVNCYVAERRWAEAVTANNRAEQQLRSLPDTVWASPDLPMEKRHWERWLDSRRLLDLQAREQASVENK
ncbi:MAG: tetratricopeptide repeat protein [Phycisphaerales bacterium]